MTSELERMCVMCLRDRWSGLVYKRKMGRWARSYTVLSSYLMQVRLFSSPQPPVFLSEDSTVAASNKDAVQERRPGAKQEEGPRAGGERGLRLYSDMRLWSYSCLAHLHDGLHPSRPV
jgi:hypothetical protein